MDSIQRDDKENDTNMRYLDQLNKRKVIEHNDLISSVAKMDKVPLKIFELAVSCIDTTNPPKDNKIYLSKTELFTFFDVSDSNKHSRFKEAIEKMQKQSYFEVREKTGKGFEFESIVPIPYIKWNNYNDKVVLQFTPQIMPYLIELKSNFTQYAIRDIMDLNSKYSIIIYKWLCMFYNQYEHYNSNGGRRQSQIEQYRNPSISVKELRQLTDTTEEYKAFKDFEKRVLKQAISEINRYTHFSVTYHKIKKGRSINSIQFYIEKKKIVKNYYYKEEEQDSVYLQEKADREQRKKNLLAEAMQSPYTTILGEYMFIGFKDMQNIELIINLQQVVYPLYDELKLLRGLKGVKDHLLYVSNKQEGYSKRNIVKYLKIAIEGYLLIVKRQDLE